MKGSIIYEVFDSSIPYIGRISSREAKSGTPGHQRGDLCTL